MTLASLMRKPCSCAFRRKCLCGGYQFSGQVNLVVVPETSSVGLLGLTALLTLRRRRRAA